MTPAFLIYLSKVKKQQERRFIENRYSVDNLKHRPCMIIG